MPYNIHSLVIGLPLALLCLAGCESQSVRESAPPALAASSPTIPKDGSTNLQEVSNATKPTRTAKETTETSPTPLANLPEKPSQGGASPAGETSPTADTTAQAPSPIAEPLAPEAPESVYFKFDQAQLNDQGLKQLKVHADYMKAMPERDILLKGHTDHHGAKTYNQALAKKRAESVRQALIALGVEADRIKVESLGEIAKNDGSGASQARRVDLVYPTKTNEPTTLTLEEFQTQQSSADISPLGLSPLVLD